ncbi:hypothetical protein FRC01_004405 [Tulasnella sp. 417]|nr:hypothetical protein FRC01_004405 [Tulasnella sp. 417]
MDDSGDPAYFGRLVNNLWGNIPAYDILNVPMNEGDSIRTKDLTMCFAASGDLNNVIKTINGLPLDYTGRCTLVINDFHPQVAIRNVMILCMLLDPWGPSAELTAEAVLHTMYSASLTSAQHEFVADWMDRIIKFSQGNPEPFHGEKSFNSRSSLEWWFPWHVDMLFHRIKAASYSRADCEADRRRIVLSSQRFDYRERYYSTLRPRHRAGCSHWLDTGILLPLGQPVDSYNMPNRLLYSADGKWLLTDSASPVFAWNPLDVEGTRKHKGLPDEDYFGSLFFHIKQQLVDFISRARRFNLSILLFSTNLHSLPGLVDLAMEGRRKLMFDRVETSNVMDTTGASPIISNWGPCLNRKNPHATLLMYSKHYPIMVNNGTAESQPRDKINRMAMELYSYLRIGVELKDYESPKITITPEEFYFLGNISFATWYERFVEFGPVE